MELLTAMALQMMYDVLDTSVESGGDPQNDQTIYALITASVSGESTDHDPDLLSFILREANEVVPATRSGISLRSVREEYRHASGHTDEPLPGLVQHATNAGWNAELTRLMHNKLMAISDMLREAAAAALMR